MNRVVLEISFHWECPICGYRQLPKDNEEWPYHCNTIMKYGACRGLKVYPNPTNKEGR